MDVYRVDDKSLQVWIFNRADRETGRKIDRLLGYMDRGIVYI